MKGASLCHLTSGNQTNRLTNMWNITSHDSTGKRMLQGLPMAIKFPSWEMTQVTSACGTLDRTSHVESGHEGAHDILGECYCPPHHDFTSSFPARRTQTSQAIGNNNRQHKLSPESSLTPSGVPTSNASIDRQVK